MIVLLNGTSSAGKTTLARAVQDALPSPCLLVGIDTVVYALPERYLNADWAHMFSYEHDADGRISRVTPTEYGHRLVRGLHAAVAGLAHAGLDVIVDHVVFDRVVADDLADRWRGLDVLRVKVDCPREVVERRERDRADRTLGQAGALAEVAHVSYDLTVDTGEADPEACAAQVVAALWDRRLLGQLARDHARLRTVAARDLAAPVPDCPGWTVEDLVRHVANGYRNVVVRRLTGTPEEDLGPDPMVALDRGYAAMAEVFAADDPARQVGADPAETVRTWIRRMAHEIVVHRLDAERAVGEPAAPVESDIAADGVAEALAIFLRYSTHAWTGQFAADLTEWRDRWLLVSCGYGPSWRVSVHPSGVEVEPAVDGGADASVRAEPLDLMRWLYGRAGGGPVAVDGDRALVDQVSRLLRTATGVG